MSVCRLRGSTNLHCNVRAAPDRYSAGPSAPCASPLILGPIPYPLNLMACFLLKNLWKDIMIQLLLRQSPPAKKEYFMSILSSPAYSGSSPAAVTSLSPHSARGRKKAALPLILFRVFAVLFLFCGTLPASALEGQCLDRSTWKLTDGTLAISGDEVF